MQLRKRKIAGLLAFVFAAVVGISAYAFTASNTVEAHSAGAGVGSVSGYTVKSPANYTFDEHGENMISVSFELDKAASDVQAALSKGAPVKADWIDCGADETAPFLVKCTFPTPVPDAEGEKLSVAAVSSGTVTIE
jgi:hypothetical protein